MPPTLRYAIKSRALETCTQCSASEDRLRPSSRQPLAGPSLTRKDDPMPAKRELIDPKGDKRYVRRGSEGRFKESDDVGRSLSMDQRKKAKMVTKPGQGDKGDRKNT